MEIPKDLSDLSTEQLVGVGVALLFTLWFLFGGRRPANAPPNAYVGWPLIGNYVEFAKNPVNFIAMCQKAKGDLFTVPMGPKKLTFLLGPECSAPFYQNKDDVMSQSEVYSFMTPVFGKNVVYDAPEKKRLQQMQHMATGLRSTRLEVYVPKFEAETIAYLKRWGDSGEVNILDALSELTILTASRCLHGDDVREDLFEEVSQIYHDLDKGVTPLSFFWPGAPTAAHAKRDAARLKMVEIFGKVIRARRENDAKNNVVRTDILQVFMDMKYKDGSVLTDDEITGLLIALLFAGQHTSSITSTWTTMFLLHNKDSMDKAMAEQHKVLGGDNKKPLTLELVKAMDFMYASVKESLRLHPPLIMLMRQAMVDVKTTLNGKEYVIPAGDICVTSPAVSSRMASVFPEPDKFKPERFENDGEARMPQFSYLGFGGGRHQCMGQAFGLLQVSTITSILLRNFDFELVTPDKFPEPDYEAMVVGPKNHCMLRYKKKADAFI